METISSKEYLQELINHADSKWEISDYQPITRSTDRIIHIYCFVNEYKIFVEKPNKRSRRHTYSLLNHGVVSRDGFLLKPVINHEEIQAVKKIVKKHNASVLKHRLII